MKRLLLVPYAFVLMNWAAMRALFCFLRRRRLLGLWAEGAGAGHRGDAASRGGI